MAKAILTATAVLQFYISIVSSTQSECIPDASPNDGAPARTCSRGESMEKPIDFWLRKGKASGEDKPTETSPSTLMSLERSWRTQLVYEGSEREYTSPIRLLPENTTYLAQRKIFFTFSLVNSKKSINFAAANDSSAHHSDGA